MTGKTTPQATVALVQGEGRYDNARQALQSIAGDVDLSSVRSLLIKPNFVLLDRPLARTHIDAVRAVLDFVRSRYDGPVTIAEGSASGDVLRAFDRLGYRALAKEYDVALANLNDDEGVSVTAYRWNGRPQTLRISRRVLEADYRISVGPPKTHDTVIVTLSLKNMVMGSLLSKLGNSAVHRTADRKMGVSQWLIRLNRAINPLLNRWPLLIGLRAAYYGLFTGGQSHKAAMHQGFGMMNLNLACLATHVYPHLSVIDGFRGMEGAGPTDGRPVDWRIAVASTDWLAADTLTAYLMGYDPEEIGYLHYCALAGMGISNRAQMTIAGNGEPEKIRRKFTPHPSYRWQRHWKMNDAIAYLPG